MKRHRTPQVGVVAPTRGGRGRPRAGSYVSETHACYLRPRVTTFHRFVTHPTFIRNEWVLKCAPNTSPTMKRTTLKLAAIAISVASVLCSINSQGQSADALLDKLVEKG